MDIADQLVASKVKIDEEWKKRRRMALASFIEVYFYAIVAVAWISGQYIVSWPRGADEILAFFTRASVAGPIGFLFLAIFLFVLTGRTPLVNFFEKSSTLQSRLTGFSIGPLEVVLDKLAAAVGEPDEKVVISNAEAESFESVVGVYLRRSGDAARAAQRRPNALLFAGTFIAGAGLGFFILTLPGGQLGTQPITEASSDQLWVAGLNLLPRLLMLIFIQVLAGFFLRQYRSSMEEFRYYEAILRHRESQQLSYLLRKTADDKRALAKFAEEILKEPIVGRLARGETTNIIESQKAELNEFAAMYGKVADLIKRSEKSQSH